MYKFLGILIVLFLLVVCLVNPFRELSKDDDWAYALTVRHLLETGDYKLHDWASANMPVQIYWGALFSKLFSYSFSALRLSTLTLLFVSLIGFYFMLRDFGSDDTEAGILSLALLASPLVMLFGFSFMTCVPFMSWVILSLWLYMRAIRQKDYIVMALASLCACAAIGTRQLGVALPIGLFATWMLDRRNSSIYMAGLLLPLLASIWQFWFVITRPTLGMTMCINQEIAYLSNFRQFIVEIFWRPTIIFQYLGLFLWPLLPLYALLVLKVKKSWIWGIYIVVGVAYGYIIREALMPSIPYNLAAHFNRLEGVAFPLTVLTAVIAIVLGWVLLQIDWRAQAERFLVLTFLTLLGLVLIYQELLDEYLIAFIPFILFMLGQKRPWPKLVRVSTATFCLIALAVSSLWTYVILERKQAYWKAAEALHSTGIASEQIYAGEWSYYHSAFQEWLESGQNDLSSFFSEWLPKRISNARYWIVDSSDNWVDRVGYKWFDLSERYVYVIEHKPNFPTK